MSGLDRRAIMRGAAAAALAALCGTRSLAAGLPGAPFLPPAGPMRYTRRLVRTMAGGHALVVERSFRVRFERARAGFAVLGEQTEVAVDAPAKLAALADMERKRVEAGLFPLQLDAAGRIAGETQPTRLANLDEVISATRAVIEQRALSPGERAEAAQFLALVHSSAASFFSQLPADLFVPAETRRVEERAIDLPGSDGLVRVEFVAETDPRTGLMHHARREIVTEIDGERRVTREDWSLTPLQA